MPETGQQWVAALALVVLCGVILGVIEVAAGADVPWWAAGLHFFSGSMMTQGLHWWNRDR